MGKSKWTYKSISEMYAVIETIKRQNMHFGYLLSADEMMFDYIGLPETIEAKFLEDFLNIAGSVAIGRVKGELYAAPYAGRSGRTNQYGEGENVETNTPNGIEIAGKVGETVAVIYNNTARTPESDLWFDASTFTEIDKSSNANIIFARIAPIFAAADDTTKKAIKDIIENVIAGNMEIVTSENIFAELQLGETLSGLKAIDITEPERIQYIQYLSQFYDVLMRRHFSRRGLPMRTPTKAAQQSTDEIHGLDSVSWFYPLNKLNSRRAGLEMVNRIFGTSITVEFSEIWKQEYEAYKLRILQKDEQAETETQETETETERGVNDDSAESVDNAM